MYPVNKTMPNKMLGKRVHAVSWKNGRGEL